MSEPKLHYWDAYWDFRPAECPCDAELVEWLDETGIRDAAIFHFGTGGHHHVGIECATPERRNAVLGITASPGEHESFIRLVMERPDVLRTYNVVFGDIYLLNAKLLPRFDVATLFHLCEFRGERGDDGSLTDLEVAELVTGQVGPGGHVLFYTGSFAFDPTRDVIARWERRCEVELVGRFKSLLVYAKRG